jgi:hypothetical protein
MTQPPRRGHCLFSDSDSHPYCLITGTTPLRLPANQDSMRNRLRVKSFTLAGFVPYRTRVEVGA